MRLNGVNFVNRQSFLSFKYGLVLLCCSNESHGISGEGFRFFFFSREESRMHVHVHCGDGKAKFWLEPYIELANNWGLSRNQLKEAEAIIEGRHNELKQAWVKHFPG